MECKSLKESEYICMMNTVEITTVDPGLWKRQHGLKTAFPFSKLYAVNRHIVGIEPNLANHKPN
jgi:hypothetical protein